MIHIQGDIRKIFLDRGELLSKLYVVPGLLAAAAPLLDSVALGPSDPLVPLQQQQRVKLICSSLGRGCIKRSQAVGFGVTAARLYVQLGDPAGAARHESRTVQRLRHVLERPTAEQWEEHQEQRGESQQQQQQQGGQQVVKQQQERKQRQHKHHSATKQEQQVQEEEQQSTAQQQQQQQQQWSIDAREASALLLAPPVPYECLLSPEVWWAWQQQLMGMDMCDECNKWYRPDQVGGSTFCN